MRKFVLFTGLILILCSAASAMAQVPWAELEAGYCAVAQDKVERLDGGCFNIAGNVLNSVGIVTDIGVHRLDETNSFGNLFTYMFGPRLSINHGGRLTPFGQALVGGARLRVTVPGCLSTTGCSTNSNAWAFAAGGGVDVKLSQHIAVRLLEVEYLMTRFGDTHQNNGRFGAGIVIRLGERSK